MVSDTAGTSVHTMGLFAFIWNQAGDSFSRIPIKYRFGWVNDKLFFKALNTAIAVLISLVTVLICYLGFVFGDSKSKDDGSCWSNWRSTR